MLLGIAGIVFRNSVSRFFEEALGTTFGRIGMAAGRKSTAGQVAFTGVVLIFIGAVLFAVAISRF
jgi:hypothetical protein